MKTKCIKINIDIKHFFMYPLFLGEIFDNNVECQCGSLSCKADSLYPLYEELLVQSNLKYSLLQIHQ